MLMRQTIIEENIYSRANAEKRGGLKYGRHLFGQMFQNLYLSLFYSNIIVHIACTERKICKYIPTRIIQK